MYINLFNFILIIISLIMNLSHQNFEYSYDFIFIFRYIYNIYFLPYFQDVLKDFKKFHSIKNHVLKIHCKSFIKILQFNLLPESMVLC